MFDPIIEALITLHQGVPRKGPGSDTLSREIIAKLRPLLPSQPVMADMGCGSGYSSFFLAGSLGGSVTAVDFAPPFIQELEEKLRSHPLKSVITPRVADMLDSGMKPHTLDLIWSEGAAYAVGVKNALESWHSLLKEGGYLMLSDCCWFTNQPSAEPQAFWQENYPDIQRIGENISMMEDRGYRLILTESLPSHCWWESYFDPMKARLDVLEHEVEPGSVLESVLKETRREQALFREYSDEYGYAFYLLQKVAR
uniref:Putative SAM-dependent methyltransferases n=1 Tax=Magnetococcus massalia (strain MO-1) TaxID=451514 RepID=A0A1S7LGV4_MAGMO|nr:Putative SAM-dependent methyltransferases [Candidatus Magnetococcus massalia]